MFRHRGYQTETGRTKFKWWGIEKDERGTARNGAGALGMQRGIKKKEDTHELAEVADDEADDEADPADVAVDEPDTAEPELETNVPVAPIDDAVRVTPTARQSSCANSSAAARSSPEHVDCTHEVTLEMKSELLHKQLLSVLEQSPKSAVAMQLMAHAVDSTRS